MTETIKPEPVPLTTQSSVLSSPPPSSDTLLLTTANGLPSRQYHWVKDLPFELAQHVRNYFDERLFTQGLDFLTSITSNSISPTDPFTPMLLPSPSHLALAATITVHPSFTTRTTLREKWNQANSALRLLRLICATAGPINAKFLDAFRFSKYSHPDYSDSDSEENQTAFKTRYATTDSLFTLTDDFWSIAGWAFNCSSHAPTTFHYARWTHYELLLTFLIDLLETDWTLNTTANTAENSLIWHFIELASGGYGRSRRIMRAIFADGSSRSTNEFRALFKNELKPARAAKVHDRRRANVNIDKDEFGDYLGGISNSDDTESDDDGGMNTNMRPSKRVRTSRSTSRHVTPRTSNDSLRNRSRNQNHNDTTSSSTAHTKTRTLGPASSLRLRLRLLHLLSNVSSHPTLTSTSPTTFPDLDDLYTLLVEFIRPLPLELYGIMILPSTGVNAGTATGIGAGMDVFSPDAACTLIERILQGMVLVEAETRAAGGLGVMGVRQEDVQGEAYLTVGKLVGCYLPFSASGRGVVEQAKVSIGVEGLVRRCMEAGLFESLVDEEVREVEMARGVVEQEEAPGDGDRMGEGVIGGPTQAQTQAAVSGPQHITSSATDDPNSTSSPNVQISKQSLLQALETGILRRERKAHEYLDRKREKLSRKVKHRSRDLDRDADTEAEDQGQGQGRREGDLDAENEDEDEDEVAWRGLKGSGERMRVLCRGL